MVAKSKYGNKQGTNPKPDNKKRALNATENKLMNTLKKGGEPTNKINTMKTFLKKGCGCVADAKKHADKKHKKK